MSRLVKKFFVNFFKIILFFTLWALSLSLIDIDFKDPVLWRFWAEFVPFISVVFYTIIFLYFEKNRSYSPIRENFKKASLDGTIIALFWLIIPVIILLLSGKLRIQGEKQVAYLGVWISSAFINVLMQELLIRGYIYGLLKKEYSTTVAVLISSLIFTLLHGGAFEEGIIPVLNVVTMSLFMSFLYEYEGSLMAPVMAHSIWNILGGIFLGTVSLAPDYPSLYSLNINNSPGVGRVQYKLEYSLLILLINILLSVYFYWKMRKKDKKLSR